ncbi:MAG: GNAT family N-acetyltransferase [Candidatus Nanoarchaeia archaeon]|nr:GNAT family N-acetyltransferase [Candidatus Nanoarchaeia archaeon]
MQIKRISPKELAEADRFQISILNPTGRRIRKFSYIKAQYKKHPSLFIACYNPSIVGIVFGFVKREKVLLGELAIKKELRGKGIGLKLVNALVKEAKALRKKEVCLGAQPDAEKFYLKAGFKPILFVQIHHKDIPKNYLHKGFKIEKETNYKDAKRLFIHIKKYDAKLKEKAKKAFNAYDVIYLFVKKL